MHAWMELKPVAIVYCNPWRCALPCITNCTSKDGRRALISESESTIVNHHKIQLQIPANAA